MNHELLMSLFITAFIIFCTTVCVLFSANHLHAPKWLVPLCKALGFMSLGALPVLLVMVVWTSTIDELLTKLLITDSVILLTAVLFLDITRRMDIQSWVTLLCKGLLYIPLASIPVLSVMAVWI
jgi:hypothetical protein